MRRGLPPRSLPDGLLEEALARLAEQRAEGEMRVLLAAFEAPLARVEEPATNDSPVLVRWVDVSPA